jgi:carboxymethylenebutenolidase
VSDVLNEHTPVAPVSLTGNISCPVLGNFAEEDHSVPLDHVQKIQDSLRGHGKVFDIKVYPRCPHGFFCEARESYRPEAAKDAWERTLSFLGRYLKE